MTSYASRSFWDRFARLPKSIQKRTRKAHRLFLKNPAHPSLRFERLKAYRQYWSVRISLDYRAAAVRDKNDLVWFWIGTHREFDRDFG